MQTLAGRLLRRGVHLLTFHSYVKKATTREDVTRMLGFELRVPPTVFHPRFYRTSRFFGDDLEKRDFHGKEVLDVGCGSGILSLVAARRGAQVTSVDINPRAVDCTSRNAAANRLQESIVAVRSDLFGEIPPGRRFDYIVWNPPFYPAEPTDDATRAWNAGDAYDVIARFASSAGGYLREGGTIIIVLSSDIDIGHILSLFSAHGLCPALASARRQLFETLSIYEIRA